MTPDATRSTTVRLPEELNDKIERELDYDDAKGQWIREACQQRLAAESESTDAE